MHGVWSRLEETRVILTFPEAGSVGPHFIGGSVNGRVSMQIRSFDAIKLVREANIE